MAKTLDLGKPQSPRLRTVVELSAEPFARTGSSSFYRCLGTLPPKHLGGKGSHIATKEEARCTKKVESTIKVESMDAVHGRGAASPKLKRGTIQPGRWAGAADVERVPR